MRRLLSNKQPIEKAARSLWGLFEVLLKPPFKRWSHYHDQQPAMAKLALLIRDRKSVSSETTEFLVSAVAAGDSAASGAVTGSQRESRSLSPHFPSSQLNFLSTRFVFRGVYAQGTHVPLIRRKNNLALPACSTYMHTK